MSLIRKMVHYAEGDLLIEMTGPESHASGGGNFASSLSDVLSLVLDVEVSAFVKW